MKLLSFLLLCLCTGCFGGAHHASPFWFVENTNGLLIKVGRTGGGDAHGEIVTFYHPETQNSMTPILQ